MFESLARSAKPFHMMKLFGSNKPLCDDEWDWQLASFKWLITEFGGAEDSLANQLILPTDRFFPKTSSDPSKKAREIFEQVKHLSGLAKWPTKLVAGNPSREMMLESGQSLKHDSHAPAGEYRLLQNADGKFYAQIGYNPSQLDNPHKLIATFAHELSHFLMSSAKTPPPGGWEIHELTTDLCSVYLGFGIFTAMTAWNFEGANDGWKYERQGYLNEPMLITALAIWETVSGRDPLLALPYLKPHLGKDLRKAVKYLQKRDIMEEIESIDLSQFVVEDSQVEENSIS